MLQKVLSEYIVKIMNEALNQMWHAKGYIHCGQWNVTPSETTIVLIDRLENCLLQEPE